MNAEANEVTAGTKAKTPVEVVEMSDGRKVEFAGKRKLLKDGVYENGQCGVRLDFRNGETRTFWVPETLRDNFTVHGAKQKYGDETAGVDDIDDMIMAVDDLDSQIQGGKWREEREGGGFAGTSVLLRALVEYSGKTTEEIKAFLSDKKQAEKLALRGSAKLKPIIDRLEAEKLSKAAKVDTDSLLASIA